MPLGWIAAAGVVGGVVQAGAAESAAQTQADAARNAQNISSGEFNTITAQESPFMQAGYGALNSLEYGLGTGGSVPGGPAGAPGQPGFGSLNAPFTADTFKQFSPAYQFQLQQGQQGVLNADSSGQGALSGAALKDLTGFNQGLANTSFNNAFNQYQTQQSNIYGRLAGLTQIGSSAAANLGAQGVQLAGQQAQSAQNIGTALAGGTVGAGNAIGGGISNYGLLSALSNNPSYLGFTPGSGNPQNWDTENPSNFQDYGAGISSDRRLKSDIERIGTLESGLPLYRFRYGSRGPFFFGVMADEAEKVFPEAVTEDEDGFKRVDYGRIN